MGRWPRGGQGQGGVSVCVQGASLVPTAGHEVVPAILAGRMVLRVEDIRDSDEDTEDLPTLSLSQTHA